MTSLAAALEDYLAIRQGLGVRLIVPAGLLRRFVAFVNHAGSDVITTELALRWATHPQGIQPSTSAWRLGIVRRFAAWRQTTDHRTEIPPKGLLPDRYRRQAPYIYTDAEVRSLLTAARDLPSTHRLRGQTYATLFGLLAVTGLRLGEALQLDRDDVNLTTRLLTIRRTKFGKSRLVPIHASTADALARYAKTRDRRLPRLQTSAFFVSEHRARLTASNTQHTFALVSRGIGLRTPTPGRRHGRGPRLHDFRHRFAAQTLIAWYRTGQDVEHRLPTLATYLGHVHVNDTYWYVHAVPELLQLAAARVDTPLTEPGR